MWYVFRIVVAILLGGTVIAIIIGMLVGSIRNTRSGAEWSHQNDRGFAPWGDDERS